MGTMVPYGKAFEVESSSMKIAILGTFFRAFSIRELFFHEDGAIESSTGESGIEGHDRRG